MMDPSDQLAKSVGDDLFARHQAKRKKSKSQKGKGNESTQRDFSTVRDFLTFRDFSTFRDFWTPVTCRALQQKSSRIDPNVAFAPTDRERIWRSKHAAPMTFKKRRPPKGPGEPRDLLAGDSFYHRSLFVHFSTFRNVSTFRLFATFPLFAKSLESN